MAMDEIANTSRIGFTVFSLLVNESRPLQIWDKDILENYILGLTYDRSDLGYMKSWTNTPGLIMVTLHSLSILSIIDRSFIVINNSSIGEHSGAICQ